MRVSWFAYAQRVRGARRSSNKGFYQGVECYAESWLEVTGYDQPSEPPCDCEPEDDYVARGEMQHKLLEVRDRSTFIPVLAISMTSEDDAGLYLLRRVGFGSPNQIVLIHLDTVTAHVDPYVWNSRTMIQAHLWIMENFWELRDGDVVDVEFILGETATKKVSERLP